MNQAVFNFLVDKSTRTVRVERSFDAPVELVWAAWTDPGILDQWWAAAPDRAMTATMNFTEGGRWHYCIVNPQGHKRWRLFNFELIRPLERFAGTDTFCDEHAVSDPSKPRVRWDYVFTSRAQGTIVNIAVRFERLEDLELIVRNGFTEQLEAGFNYLEQYIAAQFLLRKQYKNNNMARVATYLNFPGNTEEAFNFYKSVFRTDFTNGIKRFGDLPADPAHPPVGEALKKMVLHVELSILGGHVLMGTDAPKEMGFTLTQGNNMHISLEPDSREEAERLFKELSAGGKIQMPLQDMFWGAYYGDFTDKFGINWMVNYQNKA
ncbi:hypothetical protein C7T94_05290 [Pedobacter yulinensis]|uniref:Uncharacterized protein n=1 Tax=Pedobacter yulinensis TaxID=2126353 RepID=A0A2T3HNX1_9SPHI|nr:SRPBCC domain-containing protein [Pedobacter yulinensis]PST84144.1 hypothetical protein C7T94_05290 [Pedobacter yulinensis]